MSVIATPDGEPEFQTLQDSVASRVDLAARFPAWPFRARGYATIFLHDHILATGFGHVLDALAQAYGDEAVTLVGVDPPPAFYRDEFGFLPALQLPREYVREGYGDALWLDRGDDAMAVLAVSLNVVAVTGSSGAWAVWGQRDWEIGVLLTPDRGGAWLDAGVPWSGTDVDLEVVRSPPGWGLPLSDAELAEFARQLRERGSGP